jgi:hypothetical protein
MNLIWVPMQFPTKRMEPQTHREQAMNCRFCGERKILLGTDSEPAHQPESAVDGNTIH